MELTETLDKHDKWVKGDPGGRRADLRGANLRGANLGGADLGGADLGGADLGGADLGGADLGGARFPGVNLSESLGLIWAQVGPIGQDRRTTTAVWQDGQVTHHAGCFVGNREAYEARIAAGGWDWPEEMGDLYAAECLAAIEWCEASIRAQLAWIAADSEAGTPE